MTTLRLPVPPSMNHYWRNVGRRTLISAAGREYRKACKVAAQMQRPDLHECEVAVSGVIYMARLGCDLDNRINPLLDALQDVCYVNDSQVAELHLYRSLDRGNPRVEITVRPIT